ncbi:MAG: tetratricopeptide repeat protein [Candidatus Thiodiazotropha sp.]
MTSSILQPPFVGESRQLLVDGLLGLYDQVKERNTPCWVSLEAPSGWGKTRIAQEFYARLAAQQELRYWPATILEASRDVEPMEVDTRRNRSYPDPALFDREAHSLPEFMWFGIVCSLRDGQPSQVLLEDLRQLEAHQLYLEAAIAAEASFAEKRFPTLAQAKAATKDILEEAAGYSIGEVLEKFAGLSGVPGIGLGIKLAQWGIGKVKRSRKSDSAIADAGDLSKTSEKADLLEDTLFMLTRIARPGLPLVVFVEDFHRSTSLTRDLVNRLVRAKDASIMVITTSWPDEIDLIMQSHAAIRDLLTQTYLRSTIRRVLHDQPIPKGFPAGASLDVLPESALRQIVLAYYPHADEATQAGLAMRYNNPLPLELVCTLPKFRKAFSDGALKLTPSEIATLPRKVEDLYRALWDELPPIVQEILALASLAIPEDEAAWHWQLLRNTIANCDVLSDADAGVQRLDNDQIPGSWSREIDQWLRRFNEPDQIRVARQYLEDYFRDEAVESYLAALAQRLKERELVPSVEADQHCARLMLLLHGQHRLDDGAALRAIRILQQALTELPLELPQRVRLGEQLEGLDVDEDDIGWLDARADYAAALTITGQIDKALLAFETLLVDYEPVLGNDHPKTLTIRNNIAYLLGRSGQVDKALAAFDDLLEDMDRVLGPDHPNTLKNRNNIASWLGDMGQVNESLEAFDILLRDQERVQGPDHPNTMRIRGNIAYLLGQSGQVEEALVAFETLLVDHERVQGPDHPDTLITRGSIAFWLGNLGQVDEALAAFEALLVDEEHVLGPDHPETLSTRGSIAYWLGESGQLDKALAAFNDLLVDRQRVLGPSHPSTLLTRNNIAIRLGQSGQIDEALATFQALLVDQQRVLNTDHPHTLMTRSNIATWLGQSGKIDEALTAFETLLPDFEHVFGPDHPNTLTVSQNIAHMLGQSGKIDEALAVLNELLADRQRVLGPDHPDTLTTRNNIAFQLGELSQVDKALVAFQALLVDQERVLGSDHPDTLTTRSNIATWLGKSGRVDEALAALEALLADQQRVLSPDHPHTLITQDWIEDLKDSA